jgi:hypothetical protein
MKRILAAAWISVVALVCTFAASANAQDVRFGILRQLPDGAYAMDVETTRLPRHLKESGFRFGLAIDNPGGKTIEVYEVLHVPKRLRELSGSMRELSPTVIKTDPRRSAETRVFEDFWFDAGDPLGQYRLELYINGVRKFNVEFEVVNAP